MTTIEEAEIAASKTHPRITKEIIERHIASVHYLRHGTTTICIIELLNGFKSVGSSTPVHTLNFDPLIGENTAYDNALGQLWMPFGFLLCDLLFGRLHDQQRTVENLIGEKHSK